MAFGIGRPNDQAVSQPPAANQAGKTAGPVVAAIERIDRRAASELSDHQNHRRLHQIAFVQITQQGRECGVKHPCVLAVSVEVVGVGIEAGECDFDRPDP